MTKKVTFSLAPEIVNGADAGVLLGDFNNWIVEEGVQLKKQKDGSLKAMLSLEAGRIYQYRYLLNDGRWVNDGNANAYNFVEEYGVDNCIIAVEPEVEIPVVEEKAKKPAAKKAEAPKVVAKAPKAIAPKVPKAAAPKVVVVADDLTKIEGVGKKIAELLQADGIADFATLSKATPKKIKTILEAAGSRFKVHDPATWPKQAKLAAAGKWDELKSLQAELKGGK